MVREERPDLVLLDLVLPGVDGIELMVEMLEIADLPVIFLSAYGRDEMIARAFENGAADYVVKPFSQTELSARIKAAMRRREVFEPPPPYVRGDLTIDYADHRVTLAGEQIQLTPTEYRMLAELSAHGGQLVTYERLMSNVWNKRRKRSKEEQEDKRANRGGADLRPMRTMMGKLRRKLGDNVYEPKYIFTEPRVGFRMPHADSTEEDGQAEQTLLEE